MTRSGKERIEPDEGSVADLPALTGVRGYAALGVIGGHLVGQLADTFGCKLNEGPVAQIYVDLFFVLSGYILCHVHLRSRDFSLRAGWWRFYRARCARIYPLHLATAAAMWALVVAESGTGVASAGPRFDGLGWVKEVLLLQGFSHRPAWAPWVASSWSISVEGWLYLLLFPLVVWGLRRRWRICAWAAIGVGPAVVIYLHGWSDVAEATRGFVAVVRGATGFFLGAAMWAWRQRSGARRSVSPWATDAITVVLFGVNLLLAPLTGRPLWGLLLVLPFYLAGLAEGTSLSARAMAAPVSVFLGRISYSLYLVHLVVFKLLDGLVAEGWIGSPLTFVSVGLLGTLAVSTGTYYGLERPARRWLRGATRTAPGGVG